MKLETDSYFVTPRFWWLHDHNFLNYDVSFYCSNWLAEKILWVFLSFCESSCILYVGQSIFVWTFGYWHQRIGGKVEETIGFVMDHSDSEESDLIVDLERGGTTSEDDGVKEEEKDEF
jgi:hypothetical protein